MDKTGGMLPDAGLQWGRDQMIAEMDLTSAAT